MRIRTLLKLALHVIAPVASAWIVVGMMQDDNALSLFIFRSVVVAMTVQNSLNSLVLVLRAELDWQKARLAAAKAELEKK